MYLLEIQLAQVLAFSLLPACMNRSSFKQTRRLGPPLPDVETAPERMNCAGQAGAFYSGPSEAQ